MAGFSKQYKYFFLMFVCIFIIVCQNNHIGGHSLNAERKQMKIGFIFVSKHNLYFENNPYVLVSYIGRSRLMMVNGIGISIAKRCSCKVQFT